MASTDLLNNIKFYFLGTFSTKLLQFLFIPIYSKYISTFDYGEFSLILSMIFLIVPLLFLSIWEGAFRFTIEEEGNEQKTLATVTKFYIALICIYSFFFFIISFFLEINYKVWIWLMALGQIGASYWQYAARALKENKMYTFSTIMNSFISIVLNFILIIFFNWGIIALFIANTIGNLSMVFILEKRLKLLSSFKYYLFDKPLFIRIIYYSLPLSINAISWWMLSSFNNFVISSQLGVSQNGIYNIALRFGSILSLITSVVNMAWLEESFRCHEKDKEYIYFNKVLNLLTRIMFGGVIVLIPLTYIVYKFFVFGEYKTGVILTGIIYIGAIFNTLATHLGSVFLAQKKSHIMFLTTLTSGIITVILSLSLVYKWGLIGIIWSSTIGFIIMYLIRIGLLYKKIHLQINYRFIITMSILCISISHICNMNNSSVLFQSSMTILTMIIAFATNKELIIFLYKKATDKK